MRSFFKGLANSVKKFFNELYMHTILGTQKGEKV